MMSLPDEISVILIKFYFHYESGTPDAVKWIRWGSCSGPGLKYFEYALATSNSEAYDALSSQRIKYIIHVVANITAGLTNPHAFEGSG
jgi:hypothetical protein